MLRENQAQAIKAYGNHHLMNPATAQNLWERSTYGERSNVIEAYRKGLFTNNVELIKDLKTDIKDLNTKLEKYEDFEKASWFKRFFFLFRKW